MGALPGFRELVKEGTEMYGPSHGSSRHSNVRLEIYGRFEGFFSQAAKAEKALTFSSGYMAGMVAVQTALPQTDLFFAAPDTHPSILPSGYKMDPDCDFSSWVENVIERCEKEKGADILLLANAVNSLKPEIYDFDWVKSLSGENRYTLLIDDSHAFGVWGEGIFGTYGKWQHLPVRLLVAGSLGKALALPAGMLLGSSELLGKAENHVIFRSSSPPAPGPLYAFLEGQSLYASQHRKLKENMAYCHERIGEQASFRMLPDYPVITFEPEAWVDLLEKAGIILSSFPYPTPHDPPVNRLVLSAYHLKEDLDYLAENLYKLEKKVYR
jgi:7-keto-8-aminopelargonate synthetase-like enzyme